MTAYTAEDYRRELDRWNGRLPLSYDSRIVRDALAIAARVVEPAEINSVAEKIVAPFVNRCGLSVSDEQDLIDAISEALAHPAPEPVAGVPGGEAPWRLPLRTREVLGEYLIRQQRAGRNAVPAAEIELVKAGIEIAAEFVASPEPPPHPENDQGDPVAVAWTGAAQMRQLDDHGISTMWHANDAPTGADIPLYPATAIESLTGRVREAEAEGLRATENFCAAFNRAAAAERALVTAKADAFADIASALAGRGDIECAQFVANMEKGE